MCQTDVWNSSFDFVLVDGSLEVNSLGNGSEGEQILTDDFTVSYLDAKGESVLSATFSGYALEGDFFAMLFGDSGEFTLIGETSIEGMGNLSFSGDAASEMRCDSEYESGAFVMEGTDTVTLAFDGEKNCDGCIPWSSEGGLSGEICEDKK